MSVASGAVAQPIVKSSCHHWRFTYADVSPSLRASAASSLLTVYYYSPRWGAERRQRGRRAAIRDSLGECMADLLAFCVLGSPDGLRLRCGVGGRRISRDSITGVKLDTLRYPRKIVVACSSTVGAKEGFRSSTDSATSKEGNTVFAL